MTHHSNHEHPPGAAHGHAAAFHDDRMAALLEAEGELAAGLTGRALALCIQLLDGGCAGVRRLADLGCGPGVATTSLATAFEGATVVGVDGSSVMRARAARRATRLGVSDRVELKSLDLNDDLRSLGTFDLVWAALALHHTVDERAALENFAALLRPQGLLCLIERAEPMVVRPAHDLGRPGIWDRVDAAHRAWCQGERGSPRGPTSAESYAVMLGEAGLELLDARTLAGSVTRPVERVLQPVIRRYVGTALHNLRDTLLPADVDALEHAEEHVSDVPWGDAVVTSSRALFIARRPGSRPRRDRQ